MKKYFILFLISLFFIFYIFLILLAQRHYKSFSTTFISNLENIEALDSVNSLNEIPYISEKEHLLIFLNLYTNPNSRKNIPYLVANFSKFSGIYTLNTLENLKKLNQNIVLNQEITEYFLKNSKSHEEIFNTVYPNGITFIDRFSQFDSNKEFEISMNEIDCSNIENCESKQRNFLNNFKKFQKLSDSQKSEVLTKIKSPLNIEYLENFQNLKEHEKDYIFTLSLDYIKNQKDLDLKANSIYFLLKNLNVINTKKSLNYYNEKILVSEIIETSSNDRETLLIFFVKYLNNFVNISSEEKFQIVYSILNQKNTQYTMLHIEDSKLSQSNIQEIIKKSFQIKPENFYLSLIQKLPEYERQQISAKIQSMRLKNEFSEYSVENTNLKVKIPKFVDFYDSYENICGLKFMNSFKLTQVNQFDNKLIITPTNFLTKKNNCNLDLDTIYFSKEKIIEMYESFKNGELAQFLKKEELEEPYFLVIEFNQNFNNNEILNITTSKEYGKTLPMLPEFRTSLKEQTFYDKEIHEFSLMR